MKNLKHTDSGWTINTVRNSPIIEVQVNGKKIPCRILEQIITAPDGSKIKIEQHISNNSDYHDIWTTVVTKTTNSQ